MFSLIVAREPEVFARKLKNKTFLRMNFFLLHEQHVNSGVNNKRAKNIEHPGKALNQLGARKNHYAAHDQRPEDSPLKHAVLQAFIDSESAEDHQKKKKVVNAERLFDYVAGEELQARLLAGKVQDAQPK